MAHCMVCDKRPHDTTCGLDPGVSERWCVARLESNAAACAPVEPESESAPTVGEETVSPPPTPERELTPRRRAPAEPSPRVEVYMPAPGGGRTTCAHQLIDAAFSAALRLDEALFILTRRPELRPSPTLGRVRRLTSHLDELALDAHNEAFRVAADHGWNYECDEDFMDWALHAPSAEILEEGRRRALNWVRAAIANKGAS